MALVDLVRNGVALADRITNDGGLQVDVTHKAWIGQDDTGKPLYATGVARQAIVTDVNKRIKRDGGEEIVAHTYIGFLRPIAARTPAVVGRHDPLDERDQLVLPGGRTGPIVDTDGGLVDSLTGRTFLYQCWLG